MNVKEVLQKKLAGIKLSGEDEKEIKRYADAFVVKLNSALKRIGARAMLGGSFSKGTAIKKKSYDVDVFVMFKKGSKDISELLERVLKKIKVRPARLPGSRDYFNVDAKSDGVKFRIEIVPVIGIKKASEALNVTDVSPLHVHYVKKKVVKNKKLADEIRLAKAFCFAQDCYGAESHIRGFSGYCLEVLTLHFRGFLGLLRAASKWQGKEKVVIDPVKYYKNGKKILQELNEAKLMSPLILIDPVQKERNVAAALNKEQFEVLAKAAKAFLKRPSMRFFERKEINEKDLISDAKKRKLTLLMVNSVSKKKKEDISGAKLLKLHNLLKSALGKEGYVFRDHWLFEGEEANSYFLITKKPKKVVQKGPPVVMKEHAVAFKRKWKGWKVKSGKLFVERKLKSPERVLGVDKDMLKKMGINSFSVKKLN